jgi:hypothetical protein
MKDGDICGLKLDVFLKINNNVFNRSHTRISGVHVYKFAKKRVSILVFRERAGKTIARREILGSRAEQAPTVVAF